MRFRRVKPTSVNLESEPIAKPIAGVLIYRFDSALVFFNSHHFASRVRQVIREAKEKLSWFVLDSEAITLIDSNGADTLESLRVELQRDDYDFVLPGRRDGSLR